MSNATTARCIVIIALAAEAWFTGMALL